VSYSYQWQDCHAGTCSDVAGADLDAYTLAPSDVGEAIDVVETAQNVTGSAVETSAQTGLVVASPTTGTPVPLISGTAGQGGTLSASTGTFYGSGIAYSYQWQDCVLSTCTDISGATSSSYQLASSDAGYTVEAVVTATNQYGIADEASSPTGPVMGKPLVTGTEAQGDTLSVATGPSVGNQLDYSYQWQDCDASDEDCVSIAGATSSTYVLGASDVGKALEAVVTAPGATGATMASSPTALVTGPPSDSSAPSITGTVQIGQTLTASAGTWIGYPSPSYAYQWERCDDAGDGCSPIAGAD
jgi:hypothetical protein